MAGFYTIPHTKIIFHFPVLLPLIFDFFEKELLPYEVTKSAIKFPLHDPIPVKLMLACQVQGKRKCGNREKKKK